MLGNLIENAAKYGGGSVFVTVERVGDFVEAQVEDDGMGIPKRNATASSIVASGSIRASRVPVSVSLSFAMWPKSMAAASRSKKAKISADSSPACVCQSQYE